jgi:hypothetical protein
MVSGGARVVDVGDNVTQHAGHAVTGQTINPVEAFTPFSPEEIRRLTRYVERTDKLIAAPFIQGPETSWTVNLQAGEPIKSVITGAEDADVRDALMLFRPLHLRDEKAGFMSVQNMVKRHAYEKGTDAGPRAIDTVKTYTAGLNKILSDPDLMALREEQVDAAGNVVHTEDVAPRRVFDDFLYGVHFHEDEERMARIGEGFESEPQRFLFLMTVRRVAHVYIAFAGAPKSILREPSLRS